MQIPESDQEFGELLRSAEPSRPPTSQTYLIDVLIENNEFDEQQQLFEHSLADSEAKSPKRLVLSLLATSAVICIAFLLTKLPRANRQFEFADSVEAGVSKATGELVQAIAQRLEDPFAGWTEEQLVAKLEQLDQEAMAIEDKLWKHRSKHNAQKRYAQPLSTTKLAVLRSSEALWLATDTAPTDGKAERAATLQTLYPNSSAAIRMREK